MLIKIFYTTIGIPGCGGILTSPVGAFSSPNHPEEYSHLLDCEWVIRFPVNDKISLEFTTFEIEHGNACRFDYVEVSKIILVSL